MLTAYPCRGNRVLIIEDEAAIAFDLEARLRDAGFEPVGPALDRDDAVAIVRAGEFDSAVVDVGVLGSSMDEIMRLLVERGVPFLFVTGYDVPLLPAWLAAAERITKPCHLPDLIDRLNALCGKPLELAHALDAELAHPR